MCKFTPEDLEQFRFIGPKQQVKPGQMWRWDFQLFDGVWFLGVVSSEAKLNGNIKMAEIRRGETFVVVATDDEGPAILVFDENGLMAPRPMHHVVMLRGTLVWIKPDEFDSCSLVKEAE